MTLEQIEKLPTLNGLGLTFIVATTEYETVCASDLFAYLAKNNMIVTGKKLVGSFLIIFTL